MANVAGLSDEQVMRLRVALLDEAIEEEYCSVAWEFLDKVLPAPRPAILNEITAHQALVIRDAVIHRIETTYSDEEMTDEEVIDKLEQIFRKMFPVLASFLTYEALYT